MYNPNTADAWKQAIRLAARGQATFGDMPVSVSICYQFPRPKSHFRTAKHELRLEHQSGRHAQKPDLDNLDKAVLDALVAEGVITDDAQVYTLTAAKWWVDKPENGGAVITIESAG